MHGNVIGASLQGAIFDNAGGNNTQTNNLFLGERDSVALMDFGSNDWPGPSLVSGNIVRRNIFVSRSASTSMLRSMTSWTGNFLKPGGSDFNIFWRPGVSSSEFEVSKVFPGGLNWNEWRASENVTGPITCADGPAGSLIVQSRPQFRWRHNSTDNRFYSAGEVDGVYVLNIDCKGDWSHCAEGGTETTALCLGRAGPWQPTPTPPAVDNQGWMLLPVGSSGAVQLQQVTNKRCLEVCYRGGAVGGCDGAVGSIVQLAPCSDASPWQQWMFDPLNGTLALAGVASPLFLSPPPRPPSIENDLHSIVVDPLFVDPEAGDFRLKPESPALALGFESIPSIEAPTARCNGRAVDACLQFVIAASAPVSNRIDARTVAFV